MTRGFHISSTRESLRKNQADSPDPLHAMTQAGHFYLDDDLTGLRNELVIPVFLTDSTLNFSDLSTSPHEISNGAGSLNSGALSSKSGRQSRWTRTMFSFTTDGDADVEGLSQTR
jgi:hypothetical protein